MQPTGSTRRGDPTTAALAAAGIAAPILFTILVVVQGLLQPDYSHVAMPISALAAWPAGWIQNLNFLAFGALMTAWAVGLHRGVRPARGGAAGPALLVVSGIGAVVSGVFPWEGAGGDFVESTGHIVGAFMTFLGAGIGLAVLSRRLARDPRWRGLAGYTLASSVAVVVPFFAYGALARGPGAPLHPWGGLVQRVAVAAWFACTVVLAVRLLRLQTSRRAVSRAPRTRSAAAPAR